LDHGAKSFSVLVASWIEYVVATKTIQGRILLKKIRQIELFYSVFESKDGNYSREGTNTPSEIENVSPERILTQNVACLRNKNWQCQRFSAGAKKNGM
jgi:hypothetical protein